MKHTVELSSIERERLDALINAIAFHVKWQPQMLLRPMEAFALGVFAGALLMLWTNPDGKGRK